LDFKKKLTKTKTRKMKKTILLFVLVSAVLYIYAQQQVALQSNGITTIFGGPTPFVNAYNASVDGDTLYLPGAVLSVPPAINKSLCIFGAGHYPDSTMATNKTYLTGTLNIQENADSLMLEGFEINGNITVANNHKVDFMVISRCKFQNLIYTGSQTTPCTYNTIKECVITADLNLSNATSCVFTNNLIQGRISYGNANALYNNIFFHNGPYYYFVLNDVDNSSISNNIFLKQDASIHQYCETNTFSFNIFFGAPDAGSNTFITNYNSVATSSLFVDQTGYAFDYDHDYHLISPELYPGNDGIVVGIYGGLYPYKTAAVPSNPHIMSKNIPPYADEEGMLNINISVNAQQD
jgi:hypothetical protein